MTKNSKSYKSLVQRDVHASGILSNILKSKNKEEIVYVLYGDLHVAREHLPYQVRKKYGKCEMTQVYLNPEKLYFQLYKKNHLDGSVVIQFTKNEFCLVESPPWVKWQSYLMYLNQSYDQLIDDSGSVDFTEHVHSLVQVVLHDLGLKIKDSVDVHSFGDLDFMDVIEESCSSDVYQRVRLSVENDLNFYFPGRQLGFLARATVNYSAHLSGLIVHALVSQNNQWVFPSASCFEQLIWQETAAFFLSKFINPNRKSASMDDLKKQLQAFSPEDRGEQSLKLALDQKMQDLLSVYTLGPGTDVQRLSEQEPLTYLRAAKLLGAMMGDKLFIGYRSGLLSKKQVRDLLRYNANSGDFHNFYIQILKTIDKIELEHR